MSGQISGPAPSSAHKAVSPKNVQSRCSLGLSSVPSVSFVPLVIILFLIFYFHSSPMASTANPTTPTPASAPTQGAARNNWRTGEPGSLPSRGHPRGGGRGGGRSGRGRGGRTTSSNNISQAPIENPSQKAPATTQAPATPASIPVKSRGPPPQIPVNNSERQAQTLTTTPSSSRPRNTRRPSRPIPAVIVAPTTPSETASAPSSSRPQNRRRRSTNKGPASAQTNVKPAPLDDSLLRPQKSSSQANIHSAPVRDRPPHLDVKKSDIDALVERVRAAAMGEDRPTTPGSHIDWAGDDDDSLPDLNDWGVTASAAPQTETISPIIVDGLLSLPDPVPKPTTPPINNQKDFEPNDHVDGTKPVPALNDKVNTLPPKPLHPSLPPKPAVSTESFHSSRSQHKKPRPQADSKPNHAGTLAPISLSTPDQPAARSAPIPQQDIAVPVTVSRLEPPPMVSEFPGQSRSAPSNVTEYAPASISRNNFQPSHMRAHTVGRPTYDEDNPKSRLPGSSTPRGAFHQHHNRTHSSPSSPSHRPPHSRPVLTGDAISKLARTIGLTSPGKVADPVAKD